MLLDGLDEVKPEVRDTCVQAINNFLQNHFIPLVVCSRVKDYEALDSKLRLQNAVCLQPLTLGQIHKYLAGFGSELEAARTTLEEDATLQELAESPMMLSVMTLAYRGIFVEDMQQLHILEPLEVRRKHVFDAYIRNMFKRRGVDGRYSPQQTIHWLSWLAQKMSLYSQSVFLIERLQPAWLHKFVRLLYRIIIMLTDGLALGLICVLIGGLVGGLGAVLFGSPNVRLIGVVGGMAGGVIGGLVVGLVIGLAWGLVNWGGMAVIHHYALRFVLYCRGHMPWNIVKFLNYATERIFLRKVGGGYMFIHRLLLEHFAEMDSEHPKIE
ncbi:MAG: hypothetical protein GY801_33865 [bacterium]|nr:hypothetical protein [bacterium]